METNQMNDRPLLDRLTPASHRALLLWCVSYALNHRDEITPDDIETLRKGDKAQQKTADLLTRYGLDLRRPA
jgi:hypothetical protein